MSLLEQILDEGSYNHPDENKAQSRGDSTAYLSRMKKRKPKAAPSQTAGRWSYNPVPVRGQSHMFTNWAPPARMSDMATPSQKINVRQESLGEVLDRIDTMVDVVFAEE